MASRTNGGANAREHKSTGIVRRLKTRRALVLAVAVGTMAAGMTPSAMATNFYWDGSSAGGNTAWNTTAGGTNWSTSSDTLSDPGSLPGSGDDVYFVFNPEQNAFATTLGQDFSIKGLFFTTDASGPVGIGGSNLLTLGSDGLTVAAGTAGSITLSTNVAIATAQTWANNVATGSGPNPLTVSGALSGSGTLSLQGTGSTLTPSGAFTFTGTNTFSGPLTLVNANTTLTLSGNGTLPSVSSITLGGGTVFTIDDTANNVENRLSSSVAVNSNGGTVNLLGNGGVTTAEQIGTLNLNTGGTNITVTPAGPTATLTIGAINRLAGAGVNFSSTGTVALTTSTLSNGIIGPWATIGVQDNSGSLDFATVSGGNVVAYSAYDITPSDLTTAGTGFSTSNIKLTSGAAVMAGSSTVNTVYMNGTAGIQINTANTSTTTLTIGAGGIIANGGTASYSLGNGQAEISNATWIGGPAFSGGTTANTNTENQGGVIAVGAGVPDLVVTVAGTSNPVTGLINGALQLNVKNIVDTTSPLGTKTASTTAGSTTVTLSGGATTAGLYPGVQVTGLAGSFGTATIQYVVGIIDSTHFTIGSAPTTSGAAATATFVGHTGLTKNGGGLLDIADGNANNKTVAYSYQGDVTVNGGILLVGNDANFGVIPNTGSTVAGFNPAAITLNGGEIRSTAGLNFNTNRGITVGPQGGTLSYVGGSTLTLAQKITGPGGMTFNADSYSTATGLVFNINNSVQDTYQGPTIIEIKNASTMNVQQVNPLPPGTAVTLALAPNFQNGTNGNALPVTGFGTLNLSSSAMTIGSLASPVGLSGANLTGTTTTTLAIGGTVNNPVAQTATFNGIIAGANLSLVKNGGGTQSLAGANSYAGGTTINGGTLSAINTTGSATGTGAVTVASGGTLGGSGIINGLVTVQSGGALAPAITPSGANTLQLAKGLTLNGGSALNFNLGAINSGTNPIATPNSDNIFVTGTLAVGAGSDTINITPLGLGINTGTYQLITATTVPANFTGTTFNVSGPSQFLYQVNDDTTNKSLDLVVTLNPNPPATWLGATAGSGMWDTTSTIWKPTGGSGSTKYTDGSAVTFDNTPGGAASLYTITINNNVAPASVTFNNNAANNYLFTGTAGITGGVNITKGNTGTVTFDNANTLSGVVSVQGGTMNIGDPNNTTAGSLAASAFNISSGAILNVNGAGTLAATAITNGGTLKVAAGAVINGASTLGNSSTATFNNAAQSLSGLSGTGSLVLNGTALSIIGGTTEYDGVISGATGSLAVSSGAILTLTNPSNAYGAGTTISSGTLVVSNSSGSATGPGAVAVNNGGILGGSGVIGGSVTLSATGIGHLHPSIASGTPTTLTINNNLTLNAGTIYDYGLTAGSSDLVKVNGNLAINGAQTVNLLGAPTLSGGAFEMFGYTGTLSGTPTFTVNNVPAGDTATIYTPAMGGPANQILLFVANSNPALKWTGTAGTSGVGAWDLTSANWTPTPTGLYTNGGPVIFDNSGTNPGVTTTVTIAAGGVSPSGITFNNGATDPSGTSATAYILTGSAISGPGSLTLSATAGTVTLAGANAYFGGTVVNAGQLLITNGTGAGTGAITLTNGTISAGFPTGVLTMANPITLSGGTFGISASGTGTGVGPTTLSGAITVSAAATITLDDFDPIGMATPVAAQDLILTGSLSGSGNIIVTSFPGDPRDGNGLRLRDSTASTFSGTITLQPATKFELQTTTATGSPMGTGTLIVQPGTITSATSGGTFPIINLRNNFTASVNLANPVQIPGSGATGLVLFNLLGGATGETDTMGALTAGGAGANISLAAVSTASPVQTIAFPSIKAEGGSIAFQPGIPLNTDYVIADNISVGAITEDPASSGGPTSITLNGIASLTLTGTNSYAGTTTVNSGKLLLGKPGSLPATTALIVNGGGTGTGATVDFNSGLVANDQTVASLSGNNTTPLGTITNSDAANLHMLTVAQTTNTTYSGAITGNLALTKSLGGSLELAGSSTYSGPTNVNAGVLSITGSIAATSGVTIASSASLIGVGTIGGTSTPSVQISAGGTLSPGNAATPLGALTLKGPLTFASSTSIMAATLGPSGTNSSAIVTGITTLGGATLTVNDSAFASSPGAAAGTNFFILDGATTSSTIAGTLSNGATVAGTSGTQYTITIDTSGTAGLGDPQNTGNFIELTSQTVVPEPASLSFVGIGALGLLLRRRRRSR